MVIKIYEFNLEKYNNKSNQFYLTNYHNKDINGKCTTLLSNEDKMVIENLKGLLKKLNSNKLKIRMEIS